MAKTRAQRKAEQRRRAAQQRQGGPPAAAETDSEAQRDTQVPQSADVTEAELAERGADLEALKDEPADVEAPAPSRADVGRPEDAGIQEEVAEDKISRRARRREERARRQQAKESERRRAPREEAPERQRGAIIGFIASCWAELRRVQWPDRETLIQASAVTLVFIAIMAAYLGVLDAIFNWVVQRVL